MPLLLQTFKKASAAADYVIKIMQKNIKLVASPAICFDIDETLIRFLACYHISITKRHFFSYLLVRLGGVRLPLHLQILSNCPHSSAFPK